jgi:hypothetical protein
MRIMSHHNHHYLHVRCLVCGHRCELNTICHDAYDDDGEHVGSVCDACMVLTSAERRVTIHAQADALRAEADDLDAMAEEVWHLARTDSFIDVQTGIPSDDAERCDCADVVQPCVISDDTDDEDIPF